MKHMTRSIVVFFENSGVVYADPQAVTNVLHALAVLNVRDEVSDMACACFLPMILTVRLTSASADAAKTGRMCFARWLCSTARLDTRYRNIISFVIFFEAL